MDDDDNEIYLLDARRRVADALRDQRDNTPLSRCICRSCFAIREQIETHPNCPSGRSLPDRFESGVHALIVGFIFKVPPPSFWVLVDIHERLAGEFRQVARNCAVRFVSVDAL